MTHTVRIGMLKALPRKWDVAANWSTFVQQFERHREDGLDVFITPECFLDGYAVTEEDWTVQRFAEVAVHAQTDPHLERVAELASLARCCVVFGCTEILDGRFHNAALLYGPDGRLVGRYHKTHLQHHDHRFTPGDDLPTFDLPWGRAGIVICADRRWPETLRVLRLKGARVCLMPTYGMHHLDNEWWMRTRSYENQMFVCFAHPEVSLITDPAGQVAARLESNQPDVLVHDLDLDQVRDDNHLADRRPELYALLADPTHPSRQAPYEQPQAPTPPPA